MDSTRTPSMEGTRTQTIRRTLSATSLIGEPVENAEGENLGTLKDIMLDVQSGRVAYAVLDFGGFMGMGNKLFAIPFGAFRVDEGAHALILSADRETLKSAEGFDKNNWPDTTDPEWGRRIHDYYGQTPYWEF